MLFSTFSLAQSFDLDLFCPTHSFHAQCNLWILSEQTKRKIVFEEKWLDLRLNFCFFPFFLEQQELEVYSWGLHFFHYMKERNFLMATGCIRDVYKHYYRAEKLKLNDIRCKTILYYCSGCLRNYLSLQKWSKSRFLPNLNSWLTL
jgi:hypothetical protein